MDDELLVALLNGAPRVDGVRVDRVRVDGVWQDRLADDDGTRAWLAEPAPGGVPAVRGTTSPTTLGPFLEGVVSRPGATAGGLGWTLEGDPVAARARRHYRRVRGK